jgi:hypothetical protein
VPLVLEALAVGQEGLLFLVLVGQRHLALHLPPVADLNSAQQERLLL